MKLIKNIKELKQGDYVHYEIHDKHLRYGIFQNFEGERVYCFFGDSWEEASKAKEMTFINLKEIKIYKYNKEEVIVEIL